MNDFLLYYHHCKIEAYILRTSPEQIKIIYLCSLYRKIYTTSMLKTLNSRTILIIAVVLIILSGISFGMIFLVPFLPISLAQKGIFVTGLIITGEITWWTGVAVAGKQVISRYGRYFNPLTWPVFKKKSSRYSQVDRTNLE